MKEPGKEIAVSESKALAKPSYIKESTQGTEDIEVQHILLPCCKVIQPMSAEHTDSNVSLGNFANNISIVDYGPQIDFICLFAKPGWQLYAVDAQGKQGDLIARKFAGDFIAPMNADAITDDMKQWKGKVPPRAVETYLFVGIVNGEDLCAMYFKGKATTAGKKLNTMLISRPEAAFAKHYTMTSHKETNEKGTFFVPDIKSAGYLTEKEYAMAEALFTKYSKAKLNPDTIKEEAPKEEKEHPF